MRVTDIAAGAPTWVHILLAVLVVLGARRLKTREVPIVIALIPSGAFLIWSLIGVTAFAERAGVLLATSAWLTGALIGAATAIVVPEPRGQRLPDARIRQPGSFLPLFLYIVVFVARFACGAWAAIVPAQANTATAIGIAVSAAAMARLLVAISRWQPAPTSSGLH